MELYNVFEDMSRDATFDFLVDRIKHTKQTGSFLQEKFTDIEEWKKVYLPFVKNSVFHFRHSGTESSSAPESSQINEAWEIPGQARDDVYKVALNEEIAEVVDFGEYTRKKVYFNAAPGCRIPAYLLIPNGLTKPAPGVVVLHDHGAQAYWGKEKAVEHKEPIPVLDEFVKELYEEPLASTMAKKGYVTLVTDSILFGERSFKVANKEDFKARLAQYPVGTAEYIQEYNDCIFEIQADVARIFFLAGTSLMATRLWDDIASVDYLSSLPEVDSEKIGCIGLSMGGYRSGWLSIVDDRIKCAVMAGAMQRYREMMKHRLPQVEWMWTVPGLYGTLDFEDIISLRAPKPLMAVQGKQDWLFAPEQTGEKAIAHVKAVYEKAGAAQNFVCEYFDGPHVFLPPMQEKAFAWMGRYLKD